MSALPRSSLNRTGRQGGRQGLLSRSGVPNTQGDAMDGAVRLAAHEARRQERVCAPASRGRTVSVTTTLVTHESAPDAVSVVSSYRQTRMRSGGSAHHARPPVQCQSRLQWTVRLQLGLVASVRERGDGGLSETCQDHCPCVRQSAGWVARHHGC